jgi:hypothetical protein
MADAACIRRCVSKDGAAPLLHRPDDFETPRIAAKCTPAAPALARLLSMRPESPSRAIPSGATLARDGAFYVGRLNERCAEFQKKARCGLEKRAGGTVTPEK